MQNPLRLDRTSEPQPDVVLASLIRGSRDVPNFKNALLVIEVADSSYNYDCKIKAPLYARAGVPELWIVKIGAWKCMRKQRVTGTNMN